MLSGAVTLVVMAAVTVNDLLDGHVTLDVECLDRIYLNGGRRGYLIGIEPQSLAAVLAITPVRCALRE